MNGFYCAACTLPVENVSSLVMCDGACGRVFHTPCTGLHDEVFSVMSRFQGLSWRCFDCRPGGAVKLDMEANPPAMGNVIERQVSFRTEIRPQMRPFLREPSTNNIQILPPLTSTERDTVRRTEKLRLVQCTGPMSELISPATPPPPDYQMRFLQLTNVHRTTTREQIVRYICIKLNITSNQIRCQRLVRLGANMAYYNYISFKIGVPLHYYRTISNPGFWPCGMKIRDFVHRQRQRDHFAPPVFPQFDANFNPFFADYQLPNNGPNTGFN